MNTDSFIITKRDGSCESFSIAKLKQAIVKACKAIVVPGCVKSRKKVHELFSGVGIQAFEKIYTENTTSKNKQILQHAFETIGEEATPEEVINELNELAEEHKIDKRIFNGRNAETEFCECIDNEVMWEIVVEVYRKWQGREIEPSRSLKRFLEAFVIALYRVFPANEDSCKVSFVHRFAESKLGKFLGFGVRALQQGVVKFQHWLVNGVNNTLGKVWKMKHDAAVKSFRALVDKFEAAIRAKMPALALAN